MSNNTETTNPLDGITAALEKALQQAREQADTIIADARKEAERIINDAREQAERITADAQADARAKGDMERASLAIQEHAAALHTIALGLTGHDTTPHDNTGDTNGSAGDDNAGSSDADTGTNTDTNKTDTANNASPNSANTHGTDAIPPAPTATDPDNATTAGRVTVATHTTTRRANGTTRKLAPWEQPQDTPTPEPEETHANDNNATTERNSEPERAATTGDTTAPQWDAPLIIDAPLQL